MSEQQVETLTPKGAYQMMQDNPRAVLIDVRSSMEHLFVGHPKGAIHIPWMDEPDWVVNPHFVPHVRQLMLGGVHRDDDGSYAPIILICRSGRRSLDAGVALVEAGFMEVYNISEGFEGELDGDHHRSMVGGWRFHQLPWEQC